MLRLALLFVLACVARAASAVPATPAARIDHLIVGVPDLEKAIEDLAARSGVRPAIGGSHPGRGTRNALLALGPGAYLEILAPDPAQSGDNPEVTQLRALHRATPFGWAVGTDDSDWVKASLAGAGIATTAPEAGARRMPDGRTLSWRTFALEGDARHSEPFFIRWDDMARHPSRTSPAGCRIARFTVFEPDPGRLLAVTRALGLDVAIDRGDRASMSIVLDCPSGQVAFP